MPRIDPPPITKGDTGPPGKGFFLSTTEPLEAQNGDIWIDPEEDPSNTFPTATAALDAHKADFANPHGVTKAQVGLGLVNNTADVDKPVSSATQTALNAKSDTTHLHDDRYNTKTEDATALATKADLAHVHSGADITTGTIDQARLPETAIASTIPWLAGRYYGPRHFLGDSNSAGSTTLTINRHYALPVWVPATVSVNSLGFEVITAAAGSVRVGIYAHDAVANAPGALVVDAGLVSVSTTGAKEQAFTATQLAGGRIYWLVFASNVACAIRAFTPVFPYYGAGVPANTAVRTGTYADRADILFPAAWGVAANSIQATGIIEVKRV